MYTFQVKSAKEVKDVKAGPYALLQVDTLEQAEAYRLKLAEAYDLPVYIVDRTGLAHPKHGKKAAIQALGRAAKWRLQAKRAYKAGKQFTASRLITQAKREVTLAADIRSRGFNLAA